MSSALAAADDSMDGGDGWGDEEEWGSLEDGVRTTLFILQCLQLFMLILS